MRRLFIILIALLIVSEHLPAIAQTSTYVVGQIVFVNADSKPLRKLPASNSPVVTTVLLGDTLQVLDDKAVEGDGFLWWHVKSLIDSKSGWLQGAYLSAWSNTHGESLPDITIPTRPVTIANGCSGLSEYQSNYNAAVVQSLREYEEASSILAIMSGATGTVYLSYSDQWVMSAFFGYLSSSLANINPPPFALEWHNAKVGYFDLLSVYFSRYNEAQRDPRVDFIFTALLSSSQNRMSAILLEDHECSDFVWWALDQ